MKKLCLIVLLCFLSLFLSSCEITNKTNGNEISTNDNKDKTIKKVPKNKSPNQANAGMIDYDDQAIYYTDNGKLYTISKDGKDKKILFDKYDVYSFEIFEGRIYIEFKSKGLYGISSIDMNGKDLKYIDINNINSDINWFNGFNMCNNYIYYYLGNYGSDSQIYSDFNMVYRYNIKNNKIDDKFNILVGNMSLPVVYNNKLYLQDSEHLDRLIEIDDNNINYINFKISEHKDQYTTSIQIFDGYIYYHGKNYICRDNLISAEKTELILQNEGYIIGSMNVTTEYIFFNNVMFEEDKTTVQLNRVKHDGTEMKTIFVDILKKENTHMASSPIYVVDDLIFYRLRESDKIKVMDFDGNILDWGL
jgi:hypothetical protein